MKKALDEITHLTDDLDSSVGKLATVTGNLTTATERIGQLEQEVTKLPKARAELVWELVAAQVWVKEEAALVAKAQRELAELKTRQVEAATLLTVTQWELAARSRQKDQVQEELRGTKVLQTEREEECMRYQDTCVEADLTALKHNLEEGQQEIHTVWADFICAKAAKQQLLADL